MASQEDTVKIQAAAAWLQEADAVLVCAGAGMSYGCGPDYTSAKEFKEKYPGMLKYGYTKSYECMGIHKQQPQELAWGYYAPHIIQMRFVPDYGKQDAPPYTALKALLRLKDGSEQAATEEQKDNTSKPLDYFVWSSNVDGMFERTGFDPSRVYTPQGDFQYIQCAESPPCSQEVWPSKPVVDKATAAVDKQTQIIRDADSVPKCKNCGGKCFGNVRGDDTFIHKPYVATQERLIQWLDATIASGKKLVVLEVGAGWNTPIVTRFPMESVARKGFPLIRINPSDPDVPADLQRAVGIGLGGSQAMNAIQQALEQSRAQKLDLSAAEKKVKEAGSNSRQPPRYKADWKEVLKSLRR